MKQAISLYRGGTLIDVNDCGYDDYSALGLVCPCCHEPVFVCSGFTRIKAATSQVVAGHFKHFRGGEECELKVRSANYNHFLKAISGESKQQRLRLFNARFIDIYMHKKYFPVHLRKAVLKACDIEFMTTHFRKLWLPKQVIVDCKNIEKSYLTDQKEFSQQIGFIGIDEWFKGIASPLNNAIRIEVIHWLNTTPARVAFKEILLLAIADQADISPPPWHSNQIYNTLLCSLVLTDWSEALAALPPKKGFG